MPADSTFFPHLGEHCANDARSARLALWLLTAFVVTLGMAIAFAFRSL
jgi:hypothetical protein